MSRKERGNSFEAVLHSCDIGIGSNDRMPVGVHLKGRCGKRVPQRSVGVSLCLAKLALDCTRFSLDAIGIEKQPGEPVRFQIEDGGDAPSRPQAHVDGVVLRSPSIVHDSELEKTPFPLRPGDLPASMKHQVLEKVCVACGPGLRLVSRTNLHPDLDRGEPRRLERQNDHAKAVVQRPREGRRRQHRRGVSSSSPSAKHPGEQRHERSKNFPLT